MILKDWKTLEDFLAQDLSFKKTKASGSTFGDCDLKGKIGDVDITIECKYTAKKHITLVLEDYFKAKVQAKKRTAILALGNVNNIMILFDPLFIPLDVLLDISKKETLIEELYDLSNTKSKVIKNLDSAAAVLIEDSSWSGLLMLMPYKGFKSIIKKINKFREKQNEI